MATPVVGAVGEGENGNAQTITPVVLTSTVPGSWTFGIAEDWQARGNGSSTDVFEAATPTDFSVLAVRKAAATPAAGTAVTLNFSAPTAGALWVWSAIEICPSAGGTLAVSASSPSLAASASRPVTTASFTPPLGSLLVCVVDADDFADPGSANPTLTLTSTGLTFTERVRRWGGEVTGSPDAQNGVAAIFTAPVVASGARTVSLTTSNATFSALGLKVYVVTETATSTTFTKSLAGVVSPSGARVGTVVGKALTGTVAPTGAGLKRIANLLGGTTSPAGALSTARALLISFAGSVAPSGAPTKLVGKPLTGIVSPTAAVSRQIQKPLGGAIDPSGALGSIRTRLLALAGQMSPTGAVAKLVSRSLGGVGAPSGALAKLTSTRVSGATAPTGALLSGRLVVMALAGSISPSGARRRLVGKQTGGSTGPLGSLRKRIARLLTAAATPNGASNSTVLAPITRGEIAHQLRPTPGAAPADRHTATTEPTDRQVPRMTGGS